MCLIHLEANGASQTSEKTNDSLISKREDKDGRKNSDIELETKSR